MCESCVFMWLLVAIPVVIVLMVVVTVVMVALEERCQRRNKHQPCLTECLETHIFEHRTMSGTQLRQRMIVKCTHEAAREGESNQDLGSSDGAEGDGVIIEEDCNQVGRGFRNYGANAARGDECKDSEGGEDVEDVEEDEVVERYDSSGRENAESNEEDSPCSDDNIGRGEEALCLGSESSEGCSEESEEIAENNGDNDECREESLTNSGSDEIDDDTKVRVLLKHRGKPNHRMVGD